MFTNDPFERLKYIPVFLDIVGGNPTEGRKMNGLTGSGSDMLDMGFMLNSIKDANTLRNNQANMDILKVGFDVALFTLDVLAKCDETHYAVGIGLMFDDKNGGMCWAFGHYFDNAETALEEYNERVRKTLWVA